MYAKSLARCAVATITLCCATAPTPSPERNGVTMAPPKHSKGISLDVPPSDPCKPIRYSARRIVRVDRGAERLRELKNRCASPEEQPQHAVLNVGAAYRIVQFSEPLSTAAVTERLERMRLTPAGADELVALAEAWAKDTHHPRYINPIVGLDDVRSYNGYEAAPALDRSALVVSYPEQTSYEYVAWPARTPFLARESEHY